MTAGIDGARGSMSKKKRKKDPSSAFFSVFFFLLISDTDFGVGEVLLLNISYTINNVLLRLNIPLTTFAHVH